MKGKILSYDPIKGEGKIIIKNQGIKIFSIDNWIDYNVSPAVGLEIEFGMEDDKIVDILSSNSSEILLEQLNSTIEYVLPSNLKIKEDTSLNYCLEEFFEKFKRIALKYKDLLRNSKTLPYKKIKRFIFTAYNNLLEIDGRINDKNLVDVKNSLDEIEYHYDKLFSETKNPIYVTLEKLVLNKQKNYQVLKKRFENNKELITEATKNANILEIKIEKLKKDILSLKPKSKEYNEQVNILKAYKRKYVDLIDMAQNLKEENSQIIDDISQFENVYKKIFEKIFSQEVSVLLKILKKELNVLAYEFDTILWENAKKSKSIQEFFEEAKIEGGYSTKTFMKYYLKNLKTDKMNAKDSELVEIFNELKLLSKSVVIYDKNRNRAREVTLEIENLDHDTDVKIFNSLKEFIFYIKENDSLVDIAVIEVEKSNILIIQKIVPILEKLGINIVLFSENLQEKEIIKSKDLKKELKLLI